LPIRRQQIGFVLHHWPCPARPRPARRGGKLASFCMTGESSRTPVTIYRNSS
jgi:hypothetical protein